MSLVSSSFSGSVDNLIKGYSILNNDKATIINVVSQFRMSKLHTLNLQIILNDGVCTDAKCLSTQTEYLNFSEWTHDIMSNDKDDLSLVLDELESNCRDIIGSSEISQILDIANKVFSLISYTNIAKYDNILKVAQEVIKYEKFYFIFVSCIYNITYML